jgi:tetratricopeptide (TPR) repeat protein
MITIVAAKERKRGRGVAGKAAPVVPEWVVPEWRRHALAALALCGIVLAVYSNSFGAGLVFDNRTLIGQDPRIRAATAENLHLIWTQDYWGAISVTGLWRPLTTLSYLFNSAILGNGVQPAGYHWVNFFLRCCNLMLVYWLGLLVLREYAPAIALAAIWALHPVLTESVTNIVGRADLLAAFGVLAGLLCHVQAASVPGRRKAAWLCGLSLAAAIGLFSKESAVVLLAIMLPYDVAFPKASWRERAPGYAALGVVVLAYFYFRHRALAPLPALHFPFTDNPLVGAGFITGRITAVKVLGKYLWLLVWPLNLSCDYSYNQIPLVSGLRNWEDWKAIIALAAIAALAALAIFCYRRNRPVFFFVGFFFIALAPAANLAVLIGTIMAERFLYLASIGFAGCLVVAVYSLSAGWSPGAAPKVLACICVAFAVRTYARNFDWQDGKSLWAGAVESSPDSFKTHASLANPALDPQAGLDATIREIDKALAILDPLPDTRNVPAIYADAGAYYRRKGDLQKSLELELRAKRIDVAVNEENRRDDLAHGRMHGDTGWYRVDLELGRTYLALSNPEKALQAFQSGLKLRISAELLGESSRAYQVLGDPRRAALALIEAVVVDPSSTELASGLADLYQQIDPGGCSVRHSGGPASVDMNCPLVHPDICTASQRVVEWYRAAGQMSAAEVTRRSAVADMGLPGRDVPVAARSIPADSSRTRIPPRDGHQSDAPG